MERIIVVRYVKNVIPEGGIGMEYTRKYWVNTETFEDAIPSVTAEFNKLMEGIGGGTIIDITEE
jgi:hypothetical protein